MEKPKLGSNGIEVAIKDMYLLANKETGACWV